MEPIHFDKIADKLIQFRSKLPQEINLESVVAINQTRSLKEDIDELLLLIDIYAELDEGGWIR